MFAKGILICSLLWGIAQANPVKHRSTIQDDDSQAEEYANLKLILVNDLGYSQEFADRVEVNLKRAIREEKERQKQRGVVPDRLRQENQPVSEEDDDDESTTLGPTTPGPAPGDIVKGIAQLVTSLGTFNVNSFWGSFVNFFPPGDRESAMALVEASQGRRPGKWPTIPTTTTKLTTTTKDEDEIDSEETTVAVTVAATTQQAQAVTVAGSPAAGTEVTAAPGAPAVAGAAVTEAATRSPTSRYTLRPRTPSPNGANLRISDSVLVTLAPSPVPL